MKYVSSPTTCTTTIFKIKFNVSVVCGEICPNSLKIFDVRQLTDC